MRTKVTRLCLAALFGLWATLAQADEALLHHLGGQGCVIGPGTAEAVTAAGFDANTLTALQEQGEPQGAWSILPASLCQIRLPAIASDITYADAAPFIGDPDEHEEWSDYGCFLRTDLLQNALITQRGWSKDRAFQAYLTFVSKGIVDGDWRFYTTSPLRTPYGFQYIGSGDCAMGVRVERIRTNHAVLRDTFGPYLRAIRPEIPCEEGEILMHHTWPQVIEDLAPGRNDNAWLTFEMSIISMGAGWFDGMSASEKGTPRPPMCHYP